MAAVSSCDTSMGSGLKLPEIVQQKAAVESKEDVKKAEVCHLPSCFRMHYDALPHPHTNTFRGPSTYRLHSQIVLPFVKPLSTATVGELVSQFTTRAWNCYPELADFVVEALYPCSKGETTSGHNVFIGHLSDRIDVRRHAADVLESVLGPAVVGETVVYDLFTLWRGPEVSRRSSEGQKPTSAAHEADAKVEGSHKLDDVRVYTWPNVSLSEIPYPFKHRCPLTQLPALCAWDGNGEVDGYANGLLSRLNSEQERFRSGVMSLNAEECEVRKCITEDEEAAWESFQEWELDSRRRTVVLLRLKGAYASNIPSVGLEESELPAFPRTYPVDTVPLVPSERVVDLEKLKECSINTVCLSRLFARYEKYQASAKNDTVAPLLPLASPESCGAAAASNAQAPRDTGAQTSEGNGSAVQESGKLDEMEDLIDQFADFRRDLLMLERKEFRGLTTGFRLILDRQRKFEEECVKEMMAEELEAADVLRIDGYEPPCGRQGAEGVWTSVSRIGAPPPPKDFSNHSKRCGTSSATPPPMRGGPANMVMGAESGGEGATRSPRERGLPMLSVDAVTRPRCSDELYRRQVLGDKEARVKAALDVIERIDSQWFEPMWLKMGKRRLEYCEVDARRILSSEEVSCRCDVIVCERQSIEDMRERKRLALAKVFEPVLEREEGDRVAICEEEERWRSLFFSLALRSVTLLKTFRSQPWGCDDDDDV